MDSPTTHDRSFDHPEMLVSNRFPKPTPQQLRSPVIIAVHGYSSSTFEWWEFRDFAEARGIPVSLVLLGGHGRDLAAFEKSTYQSWNQPLLDEYQALVKKGYQNISICSSSTGATLTLYDLANHQFDFRLKHVYLVDPFIIPANKMLRLVDIVGPILGSLPPAKDRSRLYREHWYNNDLYPPLSQLNQLTLKVKSELEKGLKLPSNTQLTVFKSDEDPTAPLINAAFIRNHVVTSSGKPISTVIVHSTFHVYTQLSARLAPATREQRQQQIDTFAKITTEVRR